jgi:hypothetical protein
MSSRATSRARPTVAHRDEGRERLGRLTGWIAAGGIASVGLFSLATTSAPAKTPPPDTTVVTPSTAEVDDGEQPATVPGTLPPTANDPESEGAAINAAPSPVIQPPSQAPVTSGRRQHHDAAATTGGS